MIEGDRASQPWVEFWDGQLYGIDVPLRALALPLRDMCDIYHIYCFYLGGKFLLSPCARLTRLFVVVLAGRPFPLMFGV